MKLTEDKLRQIVREEIRESEQIANPTVIRTPKYDVKVYNSVDTGNLKMKITDSGANRPVADITLGKRGGQKLLDAMTYHL